MQNAIYVYAARVTMIGSSPILVGVTHKVCSYTYINKVWRELLHTIAPASWSRRVNGWVTLGLPKKALATLQWGTAFHWAHSHTWIFETIGHHGTKDTKQQSYNRITSLSEFSNVTTKSNQHTWNRLFKFSTITTKPNPPTA